MKLKLITALTAAGVFIVLMTALNFTTVGATNPPQPQVQAAAPQIPEKPEALQCLDCHRSANINTNEGVTSSNAFCYECHQKNDIVGSSKTNDTNLLVTAEKFNENQPRHRYIACINCHADVARSPHKTQTQAQCSACHTPHAEGVANEPHLRVSCQACHFESRHVRLDANDFTVKLSHKDEKGNPVVLADHKMADAKDEQNCRKCHSRNNTVGAPAAVLPSKSIMCIMCHAAPLAAGHPLFGLAGIVFVLGMALMVGFWFKGSIKGEPASLHEKIGMSAESVWRTVFSKQIFAVAKVLVLDIILQRRILKDSLSRWAMHTFIFTAILLRLMLSVISSAGYWMRPESEWLLALMDKNHGFTAFSNDLLGLFILIGIIWAMIRRFIVKPIHVSREYQDNVALILIGVLVAFGFVLEGARMLVTGIPDETAMYAFVGFAVSKVLGILPLSWSVIYGWLWYVHALTAALFVAYLPFGKMRHIFNTPLTYFIETVDGVKNEKRV